MTTVIVVFLQKAINNLKRQKRAGALLFAMLQTNIKLQV